MSDTMTAVKVNLLPQELAQRSRARRVVVLTGVGVAVWVLLLGGLYSLKLSEISTAESERDAVQAEVARLQAQVAQLEQYRELADELEARNALLAEAMATEVSYARILNDLSLAFPASSSLLTLDATVSDRSEATPGAEVGASVANLSYTGYSVERFAPGVETVLVEFDKVPVFFNPYLTTAQLDDIDDTEVTGFNGVVQLGEESYTRRYADGLPEGDLP